MNGTSGRSFYGKYRGTVVNNVDPMGIGRIQVLAPDVSNVALSSWAMPCLPAAGIQTGVFTVPIPGSGVWVEFEQGDPDHPIWTGCFFGTAAEVPALALTAPSPVPAMTLQTPLGNGILVSDGGGPLGAGGVTLKSATGALINVSDAGITIQNGKGAVLTLVGNVVDANAGALTIT